MEPRTNIPKTMGTQHPDHASTPFWHSQPYIEAAKEVTECFLSFSELGMSEYMWDWEGKLVDEAVLDRLFIDHADYFQSHPIGKEKFLTFRLPNPKVETEYRLGRAFTGMMSASALSRHLEYEHHPLFEVILPMTETADEMINVQEAFKELSSLKHPLLKFGATSFTHIELIPLFETTQVIADADKILQTYIDRHNSLFGFVPPYIRPFLARSDPALNAGLIPTVMSIKIALHNLHRMEAQTQIAMYPILGAASLPFRGGLTPYTVQEFVDEYQGISTTTIQSGFKYDYPKDSVIQAIEHLEELLPRPFEPSMTTDEESSIRMSMQLFETMYRQTVESMAPIINQTSGYFPKRRERVQHVGLFGYSRGVGKVKLPRAIGFTGALYSLGIPPEFIATGRGIAVARNDGSVPLIQKYYKYLDADLLRAGRYLNRNNLEILAKKISGFESVKEDLKELERYLSREFGPQTDEEKNHQRLTSDILQSLENGKDTTEYIEQAAVLRKSLG